MPIVRGDKIYQNKDWGRLSRIMPNDIDSCKNILKYNVCNIKLCALTLVKNAGADKWKNEKIKALCFFMKLCILKNLMVLISYRTIPGN